MTQFHKLIYALIGISILIAIPAFAETTPAPVVKQEIKNDTVAAEKQQAPDETVLKGGDTYNFYFQKSPGPNKVEQGATQKVEQPKSEEEESTPVQGYTERKRYEARTVDLFLGFSGFINSPRTSQTGTTFGGDFLPKSSVGLRGELFTIDHPDDTGLGSFKSTGGSLALSFNKLLDPESKLRLAPLLGLLWTSDEVGDFADPSGTGSSSHAYPFAGLSGTAYLGGYLGLNISVAVPTETKYTTASLSFVLSI